MDALGLLDTLIIDYRRHELQLRMPNAGLAKARSMINKPIIGVAALVVVLAAAGVVLTCSSRTSAAARGTERADRRRALSRGTRRSTIRCPRAPALRASAAPLPALADSDAPLRDALGQVAGADAVKDYLLPREPHPHIGGDHRQFAAAKGRGGEAAHQPGCRLLPRRSAMSCMPLSIRNNFERYQPMVAVISKLDMQQLAAAVYSISIRCFSSPTRTSAIRTAISTTGWCR